MLRLSHTKADQVPLGRSRFLCIDQIHVITPWFTRGLRGYYGQTNPYIYNYIYMYYIHIYMYYIHIYIYIYIICNIYIVDFLSPCLGSERVAEHACFCPKAAWGTALWCHPTGGGPSPGSPSVAASAVLSGATVDTLDIVGYVSQVTKFGGKWGWVK